MEKNEIFEKVIAILKQYAKNEKGLENVSDKSRIIEDLGINSALMIDIVADIEEQFKVRVDDEMADQMDTVGAVTKIIGDLASS